MIQDYKFQPGKRIRLVNGSYVTVEKELGEGGQGVVYRVDYNGKKMALKWYKSNGMGSDPQAFKKNLEHLARRGAPNGNKAFLWPIAVADWEDGVFGYVMELREEGYYEVGDYMLCKVQFASFRTVVDAALAITEAYRLLHAEGYSYQDLNDGNFFIHPESGKVLICDNDNVAPNGVHTGILGKPRYMAPEIVTGKNMPNTASDRFSMSVILFILFTLTHPLEGRRSVVPALTNEVQEKLYGTEPLFIMDARDRSNAPDPRIHRNMGRLWGYLPRYMQKLFCDAFDQKVLLNPNNRLLETDWIENLVRFRSEIVRCKCGNEIFTNQGASCVCEECNRSIHFPARLVFPGYAIPALHDTRIYRIQLGVCNVEEANNAVGVVRRDDADPRKLYLKNLSAKTWNATTPSGKAKQVAPKETIPMMPGIRFEVFGTTLKIE